MLFMTTFLEISRSIPEGDVLLHTGDFTMRGGEQEVIDFNEWLGTLPHKHKIVIAGNHEVTFDPKFVHEMTTPWY